MKWTLIRCTHVNVNNVDAFKWEDGELVVFFNSDPEPAKWKDPDRQLYVKLCQALGVRPYEEGDTDGKN
jgi:hypothetical protein